MKIALTAKLKNGVLWKAVEACDGSQTKAATALGLNVNEFGLMLNLKFVPPLDKPKWQVVSDRLLCLTGYTLEDAFPPESIELAGAIVSKCFKTKISMTQDVPVGILIEAGVMPKQILPPDIELMNAETQPIETALQDALSLLSPRQEMILRLRSGMSGGREYSYVEIGELLKLSSQRVRQIEARSLAMLRHPGRTRQLRRIYQESR